jgi:hypothetical protein
METISKIMKNWIPDGLSISIFNFQVKKKFYHVETWFYMKLRTPEIIIILIDVKEHHVLYC